MNKNKTLTRLPANSKLRPRKRKVVERDHGLVHRKDNLIIFLVSLFFYLVLGFVFNKILYLGNGDALSRTANAYYVIYSRDPHLAAIGFIWPPLPSLIQLPLLPILRQFDSLLMAGPLLTAFFGAGSLVLLNRILAKLNTPEKMRWLLLFLTMLHPNSFYLTAIGMSEPILLFFVLMTVWGYLNMPYSTRSWVICGVGMAMAFLVRYEAVGLIAGVTMASIILLWPTLEEGKDEMEGRLLAILVPPIYAITLWMFLSWIVMDDPLYFMLSEYSLSKAEDTAIMAGITHPLYLAWGNIFKTMDYMFARLFQQSLTYVVGTVITGIAALIQKNLKLLGLLIVFLSIPAMTAALVFVGQLPTWFRYWVYAAAYGAIIIGMVYRLFKGIWRNAVAALLVLLYVLSIPFSLYTIYSDESTEGDLRRFGAYLFDPELEPALREIDGYYVFRNDAPIIAEKVDELSQNGLVMMDAKKSHFVVLEVDHPERLVISNDTDFQEMLMHPRGNVSYILVPEEDNVFSRNYPGIYNSAYDWAKLVYDFPDTMYRYRLFEIAP